MAVKILSLELHTIVSSQLCVNVLHFQGDTAETDDFKLAKDLVDAFDLTAINTGFDANKYMAAMSDLAFMSSVVAKRVGLTPGPKYPRLYAASDFVGGTAGGVYAQSIAANYKFVTASGPDFTGRMFYPGVPEDAILENRYTPAYEIVANQLISDLNQAIEVGAATFELCVYQRSSKTAEDVTNIALSPNPGTIRRRLSPV